MIISYSELKTWDTCQKQYHYSFGLGLRPLEESEAITTGTQGHKLLQAFYTALSEGKDRKEAIELTHKKAQHLIKQDGLGSPLIKAWTIVNNYIQTCEIKAEAVLVENRFLFPIHKLTDGFPEELFPENLMDFFGTVEIGFTPDVVMKRGFFYTVEDSKFVSRTWPKSKLNHFQQAKLYQIFLQRMGYNVTQSAVRFFNLETGKVELHPSVLNKAEEDLIIKDFIHGVMDIYYYRNSVQEVKDSARRTMNYTSCQFCPFNFPCLLEAQGKDASKTLKNLYKKNDYDYSN